MKARCLSLVYLTCRAACSTSLQRGSWQDGRYGFRRCIVNSCLWTYQGRSDGIVTSPCLRTLDGDEWLRRSVFIGSVLSGVLRIIHPDQYRAGMEVMRSMRRSILENRCLSRWPSVFNAITLISDRHCPMHRDSGGAFYLYDMLISVGSYTSAPMCLMPLGVQVRNSPGTVVAFSGSAIRHGVAEADGHRICHALYMRESLHRYCGVQPCGWMTQNCFAPWIGKYHEYTRRAVIKTI